MTSPASDLAHARAAALHEQAYGPPWEQHVAAALAVVAEPDQRKADHLAKAMRRIDGEEQT